MENTGSGSAPLRQNLWESAKWAKYSALVSFISVFIGIAEIVMNIATNKFGFGLTILALIPVAITFVLAVCLFYYARYTHAGLLQGDTSFFTLAFSNLKVYFVIFGVIFLVLLALFALLVLGFILVIISKS